MKRILFAAVLTLLPGLAMAQAEQQSLVDRATLAAQDMLNPRDGTDAQSVLRHARAVMICPQVFRAGFLFGGEGGSCVLVARDGGGGWSSPAFYGLGSASFGFQAGIQDAQVMLLIMNDKGLSAVMDSQFKLGADASGTFVDMGGGIEGSTTAALRADIVGFTRARGLFAGIALSGSLLSQKTDWNQAYYGPRARRPSDPDQRRGVEPGGRPIASGADAVRRRFRPGGAGRAPCLPPAGVLSVAGDGRASRACADPATDLGAPASVAFRPARP